MNNYCRVVLFVVSGANCALSVCLVVLPLGLLYVILKHMVDRYNMYYAYVPTKLSQRIHRAAISQVMVAPVLCMFWLLFFSVLRLGTSSLLLLSCCVCKHRHVWNPLTISSWQGCCIPSPSSTPFPCWPRLRCLSSACALENNPTSQRATRSAPPQWNKVELSMNALKEFLFFFVLDVWSAGRGDVHRCRQEHRAINHCLQRSVSQFLPSDLRKSYI